MGDHLNAKCHTCQICMHSFNETTRRPKILLCGHTFCLSCLEQIRPDKVVCSSDRKEFAGPPRNLPDNFAVLELISSLNLYSGVKRFWCLECDREADPDCIEEHGVVNLKKGRSQKLKATIDALTTQCGMDVLPDLMQKLQEFRITDPLNDFGAMKAALSDLNAKIQASFDALFKALEKPGEEYKDALKSLQDEAAHTSSKVSMWQDALQLLSSPYSCSVTVEVPSGMKWAGKLRIEAPIKDSSGIQMNLLRYLLFQLRVDGHLLRVTKEQSDLTKEVEVFPHCLSICGPPNPPFCEKDTLDLTSFHLEFGFSNNSKQLEQLLESQRKVRKIVGLGCDIDEIGVSKDCKWKEAAMWNVLQCVSQALTKYFHSLEEVSAKDLSWTNLSTLMVLPKLRKLHLQGKNFFHYFGTSLKASSVGGSTLQCVDLHLQLSHSCLFEVIQCCSSSLREVAIRGVALSTTGSLWSNSNDHRIPECVKLCNKLKCVTLVRPGECPGGPVCAAQLNEIRKSSPVPGFFARCATCSPAYKNPAASMSHFKLTK